MARIKIQDLPKDQVISADELKRIKGGLTLSALQYDLKWEYEPLNQLSQIEGKFDTYFKW